MVFGPCLFGLDQGSCVWGVPVRRNSFVGSCLWTNCAEGIRKIQLYPFGQGPERRVRMGGHEKQAERPGTVAVNPKTRRLQDFYGLYVENQIFAGQGVIGVQRYGGFRNTGHCDHDCLTVRPIEL